MLSDRTIRKLIAAGKIGIEPPPQDRMFQPASVDLCLGEQFTYQQSDGSYKSLLVPQPQWFPLRAGGRVLAHTMETVVLPRDVVARVEGKSSWGRKFLMVHATAGFIDPGFVGEITLELVNLSDRALKLTVGQPIAQVSFDWLDGPADRPYGHPELGSHYQGQLGATAPR